MDRNQTLNIKFIITCQIKVNRKIILLKRFVLFNEYVYKVLFLALMAFVMMAGKMPSQVPATSYSSY